MFKIKLLLRCRTINLKATQNIFRNKRFPLGCKNKLSTKTNWKINSITNPSRTASTAVPQLSHIRVLKKDFIKTLDAICQFDAGNDNNTVVIMRVFHF